MKFTRNHAGSYTTTINGWKYTIVATSGGWGVDRERLSDGYCDFAVGWAPTLKQARHELEADAEAGNI